LALSPMASKMEGFMLKYLYLAVFTLVIAVMSTSGAVAGPQDRSVRAGSDKLDWDERWDNRWWGWGSDWDRRVCCKRGNRDWFTSARDCRNSFGYETRRRECREDEWNENWDSRWRNWDGDWNERVCCKKGDRDWWSTRRDCRDRGGWQVRRNECRSDEWNENWDSRWRNWEGDWNENICCTKGGRDWWSTRRDCRDRGGWQTERRECRND
jgi:hypothetical protein